MIQPATAQVLPLGLLQLRAQGGAGALRFAVVENVSGALLNPLSGAYLAGDAGGVIDVVVVRDQTCAGEAHAIIEVVDHLALTPANVEVPPGPGSVVQFDVTGGSGDVVFTLLSNRSGATLDEIGLYAAGPGNGDDVVEVEDLRTGESVVALVRVRAGAAMAADPPQVVVPVGATFVLRTRGGSGIVDAVIEGGGVRFENGVLVGDAPGQAVLHLVDRYTGQQADMVAVVVASLAAPLLRAGDSTLNAVSLMAGDIDGDGFVDAVLGNREVNWVRAGPMGPGGVNSGAVFLYRGGPDGFARRPVRVIGGADRRDEFGRAVAVADVVSYQGPDASVLGGVDGHVDLIVGAPAQDAGQVDNGAVTIFAGVPGGFFSDDPVRVLTGPFAGIRFGSALATCDFNGDGQLDLAVSATADRNRDLAPAVNGSGVVHVFLGYPDGFLDRADSLAHGAIPAADGTGPVAVTNLALGTWLAAGDVDGDGLCDLVATTTAFSGSAAPLTRTTSGPLPGLVAGRTNDGAVLVFRGTRGAELVPAGVERTPALAVASIAADDAGATLGRRVAVDDLDGDGQFDIAVGMHGHDEPPVTGTTLQNNVGQIVVFRGRALSAPATSLVPTTAADARYVGTTANDNFGYDVALGDATGDGRLDVVGGSLTEEAAYAHVAQLDDNGPGGTVIVETTMPATFAIGDQFRVDNADITMPHPDTGVTVAVTYNTTYTVAEVLGPNRFRTLTPDPGTNDDDPPLRGRGTLHPNLLIARANDEGPTGGLRITTRNPHRLTVGEVLVVAGVDVSGITYNGTYTVAEVLYGQPSPAACTLDEHCPDDCLGATATTIGTCRISVPGRAPIGIRTVELDPSTIGAEDEAPVDNRGTLSFPGDVGGAVVFAGGEPGRLPSTLPSFTLAGAHTNDRFAESVAVAGDVTGDGIVDIWVHAGLDDDYGFNVGVPSLASFVDGDGDGVRERTLRVTVDEPGDGGGAEFGRGGAFVGDVTGDGLEDLVVGAPEDTLDPQGVSTGSVHLYHGRGDGRFATSPSATYVRFNGHTGQDRLGFAAAGAGDFDGDGRSDFAVLGRSDDRPATFDNNTAPCAATNIARIDDDGTGGTVIITLTGDSGVVLGDSGFRVGDQVGVSFVNAASCASGSGNRTYDGTYSIAEILSSTSFRTTGADPGSDADCEIVNAGWVQSPRSDTGSVWLFAGVANGNPGPNPAFVYWPATQVNQNLFSLAGGFDWNGDGRGDVAVGTQDWDRVIGATTVNNVGGVELLLGRAPSLGVGTRTQAICAPNLRLLGNLTNDNFGRALAPLGDIDRDGCDELGVGAPGEDLAHLGVVRNDQGSVRVLFGTGPACASNVPRVLTFRSDLAGALAGVALAGSGDVDGDGIPDIVVGGTGHRRGVDTVGIVWLLRGARVAALASRAEPLVDGALPLAVFPFVDGTDTAQLFLEGGSSLDRIGNAVALVGRPGAPRRFDVVVGASGGGPAGVLLSGGARVHAFAAGGLLAAPVAVIGGETRRAGSLLGDFVAGGTLAGVPMVLVGGAQASGAAPDDGGAYAAPLIAP